MVDCAMRATTAVLDVYCQINFYVREQLLKRDLKGNNLKVPSELDFISYYKSFFFSRVSPVFCFEM